MQIEMQTMTQAQKATTKQPTAMKLISRGVICLKSEKKTGVYIWEKTSAEVMV
jgi:hypothetical protein